MYTATRSQPRDEHNTQLKQSAQVAAIGLTLAGVIFSARGQAFSDLQGSAFPTPALPNRVLTDEVPAQSLVLDPGNHAKQSNVEAPTMRRSEEALSTDRSEKISTNVALGVFGTLCSLSAMGWYYLQLRRKETVASGVTVGLQTVNDSLLTVAALATNQGISTASVSAGFAAIGGLCLWEIFRSGEQRPKFDRVNTICAVGCILGWTALAASWVPAAHNFVPAETLSLTGSLLGTAINTLSSIPLFRMMLSKPAHGERLGNAGTGNETWRILKPIAPFVVGTAAMCCALAAVNEFSFATLAQPVGLLVNNIALTLCLCIWVARRR